MADDAGSDATADAAAASRQPPPSAGPRAPDGSDAVTLVISRLYLGDTDRDGTPNANGWAQYGYDLDRRTTTASSTDVCTPIGTRPVLDGTNGVDNAFGRSVLPVLLGLSSDFTTRTNDSLAAGGASTLFTIDALGSGANYDPLAGRVYLSQSLRGAPLYDGTDQFPIDPSSLTNAADVSTARTRLDAAYLVGNTLVARPTEPIQLNLQVGPSAALVLSITHAIVTMDLAADRRSATNGTIAGILRTSQLATAVGTFLGQASASLCNPTTASGVLARVRQSSDILSSGAQDNTMPCDGISIGLGFDAARVQLGAIGAPITPTNPCP